MVALAQSKKEKEYEVIVQNLLTALETTPA